MSRLYRILIKMKSPACTRDVDLIVSRSHTQGEVTSHICGRNAIAILQVNKSYCVQVNGENLSRYSNKIESVGLRKCSYYRYLIEKVTSTDVKTTNILQSLPHKMAETADMNKLRHCHPMYTLKTLRTQCVASSPGTVCHPHATTYYMANLHTNFEDSGFISSKIRKNDPKFSRGYFV